MPALPGGRPYFVMELVRGVKITDYCDQTNLSTKERLDLFIKVCQAIQHAHQKGIIHRDIKPSNILVTLHDGPAAAILEKEPQRPSTRLTQALVAAEVTRRTAGSAEESASSRRRLQEQLHQLKGDLDWIVMKCLEKDRQRRYDTANGLAADLKRHLTNEPVLARPPSQLYRLQKMARRNKAATMAFTPIWEVELSFPTSENRTPSALAAASCPAPSRHDFPTGGHKANLQTHFHCSCNPLQHGERMALVIGVFKTRDHRLGRADQFGKLFLGELRFGSNLMYALGNLGVDHRLVGQTTQLAIIPNHTIQDFHRIAGLLGLLFSLQHKYAPPGLVQTGASV